MISILFFSSPDLLVPSYFEYWALVCDSSSLSVPLTLVLGFYVTQIVTR